MNRTNRRIGVLFLLGALVMTASVWAEPPRRIHSKPKDGAKDVPVDIGVIRLHFDQPMKTNQWTFWQSEKGEFPPMDGPNSDPWEEEVICVLKVGRLKPGTTYAVQLNSTQKQGFRSADKEEPLAITTLVFTTAGGQPETAAAPTAATAAPAACATSTPTTSCATSTPTTVPTQKAPANNAPPSKLPASARPKLPKDWYEFNSPLLGMQAFVPPGFWVRLKGGVMLCVEKADTPQIAAFMIPMQMKKNASATDLTGQVCQFWKKCDPSFAAQPLGAASADQTLTGYTAQVLGQPVEGRFCTIKAAGGTMAYVIGVCAPTGKLKGELATLQQIAQAFAFTNPTGKWTTYRSPAGGFTLSLPQGWQVQSSDGQNGKDDVDWWGADPQNPLSRAFQYAPRFCSPALLQNPLYQIRCYQPLPFNGHEQVIAGSLGQISQNVKLKKMNVNPEITRILKNMLAQLNQTLQAVQAGGTDVVAYDCLAEAEVEGKPVTVAFLSAIQTTTINMGYMGQAADLHVTLRGWCAAPERFLSDSPMLERVCASMSLTPEFINRIVQGDAHAAKVLRETNEYIRQVDNEITRNRWDTQDAIAEMYYDLWTDNGGYVNEKTGRIEKMGSDAVVKNSRGELVSREEVQDQRIPPDQATVLRGANADDYMRGVYGRIQFNP